MKKVHSKGRVQLVKLKGILGRNLFFGSLHSPIKSAEGDEANEPERIFHHVINAEQVRELIYNVTEEPPASIPTPSTVQMAYSVPQRKQWMKVKN